MGQYSQVTYAQPQVIAIGAPTWTSVLAEIIAGPTDWPVISEIGFTNNGTYNASTGGLIGIGVPAANGVGLQSALYGSQAYDPNSPASALQLISNWVTQPTQPNTLIRRITPFTEQGQLTPTILKFPRGLQMVPNQHLVVVYVGTNKTYGFDLWVEWDN